MRIKSNHDVLIEHGFLIVFALAFIFFAAMTDHFFEVENLLNILHTMSPLAITACGLALVVISGKLDISIGSTAFLSCATGALLMQNHGLNPILAALLVLACGA